VITDKKMPGMTGDDLALAIKRTAPRVPVMLCSGFTQVSDERLFDAVLTKPVNNRVLAENVQRILSTNKL
jgi:FixJ family two-component response regulator